VASAEIIKTVHRQLLCVLPGCQHNADISIVLRYSEVLLWCDELDEVDVTDLNLVLFDGNVVYNNSSGSWLTRAKFRIGESCTFRAIVYTESALMFYPISTYYAKAILLALYETNLLLLHFGRKLFILSDFKYSWYLTKSQILPLIYNYAFIANSEQ
jgi:hypothetical protein